MSCCYAMVADIPTKHSSGLYVSPVWPALPFRFGLLVDSSTSRFAEAVPHEGTESDRDHLGSGSPSAGLKNRRWTVSAAQVNSVLVYTRLTVKIINIRCK